MNITHLRNILMLVTLATNFIQTSHALWLPIGNTLNANSFENASHPAIAVQGGTLVVTWQEALSNTQVVMAKHWDGMNWIQDGSMLNVGALIEDAITPKLVIAPSLRPIVTFDQLDSSFGHGIYVKEWDSSNWTIKGLFILNRDVFKDASHPHIAMNASTTYVTWQEYDGQTSRIYCDRYNGSDWDSVGNSYTALNQTYTEPGQEPALALVNGTPYIAWSQEISSISKILVKRFNGSFWEAAGNTLNVNLSYHAVAPTLISDGINTILAWQEDSGTGKHIYAKSWDGFNWQTMGGALNLNSAKNAFSPSLALKNSTPYIAWSEVSDTLPNQQIHVRYWDGSNWLISGTTINSKSDNDAVDPCVEASNETVYVTWSEQHNGTTHILVKHDITATPTITPTLTISATLTSSPTLTATPTHTGTYTITPTDTSTYTKTITTTITSTSTISATATSTPSITPWIIKKTKIVSYPSPAKGNQAWFYFYLDEPGSIKITIYDINGRSGKEIGANDLAPGYHRLTWDIETVSPGIYFYLTKVSTAKGSYQIGPNKVAVTK